MPHDAHFEFRAIIEGPQGPFAFSGFPYIVTRICPALHHIILLPRLARAALVDWGVRQERVNRLPMCVALGWDDSAWMDARGVSDATAIPWSSVTLTGLIETFPIPADDAELAERQAALSALMGGSHSYPPRSKGYLVANRYDIQRKASARELVVLRGRRRDGVPKGLVRCAKCRRHRGECLDTAKGSEGLVTRVYCHCENDTRCARCGSPFGDERVNSASYDPEDHTIWQMPAFAALSHKCSLAADHSSRKDTRSHDS